MNQISVKTIVSAIIFSAIFISANAQELRNAKGQGAAEIARESSTKSTASGTVTYITIKDKTTEMSNGNTKLFSVQKGVVVCKDKTSILHNALQTCYSDIVIDKSGNMIQNSGHCSAYDKSGDTWSIWFTSGLKTGEWGFLQGTGKFKGINGNGTTMPAPTGNHPEGVMGIEWKGSWTVK